MDDQPFITRLAAPGEIVVPATGLLSEVRALVDAQIEAMQEARARAWVSASHYVVH